MLKIRSDENTGCEMYVQGSMTTISMEMLMAITKLQDKFIEVAGKEAGRAFIEALMKSLDRMKGLTSEEIVQKNVWEALAEEERQKVMDEELKKTSQKSQKLWNDIAGGKTWS